MVTVENRCSSILQFRASRKNTTKGVIPLELIKLCCATERNNKSNEQKNCSITCLQQSKIADNDSLKFFEAMAEYLAEMILNQL